jgi:hypothetical protein
VRVLPVYDCANRLHRLCPCSTAWAVEVIRYKVVKDATHPSWKRLRQASTADRRLTHGAQAKPTTKLL